MVKSGTRSTGGSSTSGNVINNNNGSSNSGGAGGGILAASFPELIGPSLPWRYRERRAVGRGTCSTVWTLIDNATEKIVVGKLLDLSLMSETSRNFSLREAVNISMCEHPSIIKLLGTHAQNDKLLHILEYADAGDLMTQVEVRGHCLAQKNNSSNNTNSINSSGSHSNGGLSNAEGEVASSGPCYYQEKEILVIMSQLCLAIKYIHDKKIMHRDLKTPNVLLTKSGLIKLGDFGFSRQYDQSLSANVGQTFCGTPYYLSPELWRHESYSYKADIWSLGVILYELMTLRKPFSSTNMMDLMQRVLTEGSYAPLPTDRYSPGLCDLCRAMLRVDPHTRLSITEVLATPVLRDEGLQYLKINVPRLRGVEQAVRDRLVWEVEYVQHGGTAGPGPVPPH